MCVYTCARNVHLSVHVCTCMYEPFLCVCVCMCVRECICELIRACVHNMMFVYVFLSGSLVSCVAIASSCLQTMAIITWYMVPIRLFLLLAEHIAWFTHSCAQSIVFIREDASLCFQQHLFITLPHSRVCLFLSYLL